MSVQLPLCRKQMLKPLQKCEASDDDAFWKAVKAEANRVHFRLVFRAEMQAFKRDGRKKPADKPFKKPRLEHMADFVTSAANVVADMRHFWNGDVNVEKIDSSRFGPDQAGVAVMSLVEAERHLAGQSISMEALAIFSC